MVASLLRRLLLVAPHCGDAPPPAIEHRTVLTAIVPVTDGWRRTRRAALIAHELASTTIANAARLDVVSVRMLRGTLVPMAVLLMLTRRPAVTRLLCRIAGVPPREDERVSLRPEMRAAVEIVLAERPPDDRLEQITRSSAGVVWVLSERQVLVYDEPGDDATSVFTCFLVHRPAVQTRAQCQAYWEHEHARLVLGIMRCLRLSQYRQVHAVDVGIPGCDDHYDGVVWARKPSVGAVLRQLVQPSAFRANNDLVVDETHFTRGTPALLLRQTARWDAGAC